MGDMDGRSLHVRAVQCEKSPISGCQRIQLGPIKNSLECYQVSMYQPLAVLCVVLGIQVNLTVACSDSMLSRYLAIGMWSRP